MHSKTNKNSNTIVAIFAHPDDEAFGPSGTIATLAKTSDVYLLCATRGEAGQNDGNHRQLGKVREKELRKSAKILGVKKVYFLGFVDGTLSNSLYHLLAKKIEQKLNLLRPETIISYEPRGVSGHIDHITVAMVTCYVFNKLPFIKTLMQYCISTEARNKFKNYFIYFPNGYKKDQIDKIIDVSSVWDTKAKAMMAHESQIKDAQRILRSRQSLPKEEYFLVFKK